MKLGNWDLPPYAMLAPMAGVSDRAHRELCRRFGAVASVGEMVSCKGLVQGSKKSADRFLTAMGIQEEELNVVARVNDQETVKNMVATGMGMSLISEIAARDMIRAKRMLKFELPDFQVQNMIYLYYRGRFGTQPAVQDFLDYLKHYEV